MELLANLHFLQPRLGYCLLLFLITYPESEISQDDKITLYTEFCQAIGTDCSLADSLVRDLTQCQKDDVDLFVYLVPHLYHLLPRPNLGNIPLLYLIVIQAFIKLSESCLQTTKVNHPEFVKFFESLKTQK